MLDTFRETFFNEKYLVETHCWYVSFSFRPLRQFKGLFHFSNVCGTSS